MASPQALLEAMQQFTDQVRPGDNKPYQWIYFFDKPSEAQHAANLLSACGLSARYYPNSDGAGARLYLQFNESTPLDLRLAHAARYFRLMRDLTRVADTAVGQVQDFSFQLGVGTSDGRNLMFSLNLLPPEAGKARQIAAEPMPSLASATPPPATDQLPPAAAVAAEIVAQAPRPATAATPPQAAEEAPKMMPKKPVLQKKSLLEDNPEDKKMTMLGDKLGSHMATYTSLLLKIGVSIFVLFVLFLMSRGFLCPDFAQSVHKQRPWYCSSGPAVPGQR